MNISEAKKSLIDWIDANKDDYYSVADKIWDCPELGMEEQYSSKLLIELLEKNSFVVEKGVAGMPTAFVATYGNGHPVIGFSAEYDGLPGLSQEIGVKKKPIETGAPGHGCGHNLIGVAAIRTAIALKTILESQKLAGTLKVFGTPAEELCVGKPFMARVGLFEGVDAFLDWHPWTHYSANYNICNAYFSIKYHFKGRTAHGNAPWHGRSTLDAALLQAHAVEMLREHIPPAPSSDAANTINYTFSNVGPEFPSVVPDRTTAWYIGRFNTNELMADVISRINKCAEAAAMATDTTVENELITATHDLIPNITLAEILNKNLHEIGVSSFTEEEHQFAKQLQKSIGYQETGLNTYVVPFGESSVPVADVSEYSWYAPYVQLIVVVAPPGVGWHNWAITSCTGSSIGKKAIDLTAKVLATTAIDLITNPQIIKLAKREMHDRLSSRKFAKLIPDSVNPPLAINSEVMAKYRRQEIK